VRGDAAFLPAEWGPCRARRDWGRDTGAATKGLRFGSAVEAWYQYSGQRPDYGTSKQERTTACSRVPALRGIYFPIEVHSLERVGGEKKRPYTRRKGGKPGKGALDRAVEKKLPRGSLTSKLVRQTKEGCKEFSLG